MSSKSLAQFARGIARHPAQWMTLDPETVELPQPTPRRLGRFAASGGFIIAGALGVVIGLVVAGELRSIFSKTPESSTNTTEFASRFDNSKAPEQVSSPFPGLAIGPTASQATQPDSPTDSLPIASTIAQSGLLLTQSGHSCLDRHPILCGPFAASSPATKSSLSAACCTTAATILQKVLHILPPIVVGDFFAWLDLA
jgi:hypothetical protein